MDEAEFATWLSEMHRLSAQQRTAALVRLQDLDAAATPFEPKLSSNQAEAKASRKSAPSRKGWSRKRSSWPTALGEIGPAKVESVGCPHCGGGESVGWGRAHDLERYRCKACRRTFNAATKTPLARLRKKKRWVSHAAAMIDGVSLAKAADRCGVHPSTAFRWRHRFLSAPALDKPQRLKGIVEIDETFILESFKGRPRGGAPIWAVQRASEAARPSTAACSSRMFPFSWRATAPAPRSTACCPKSPPPASPRRCRGRSQQTIRLCATAAGLSERSRAGAPFRCMS
jgi:transposase-like protein